jgi:hypothetical protein
MTKYNNYNAFLFRPNILARQDMYLDDSLGSILQTTISSRPSQSIAMDRGISLRPKRSGTRLKISNPTLISAPKAATSNTVDLGDYASSSKRPTPNASQTTLTSVQERPKDDRNRTADLVKRRYSTRFTNFDLNASTEAIPNLPNIPAKFAGQPPPSRDGAASIRSVKIDGSLMKDPNFDAEDCKSEISNP